MTHDEMISVIQAHKDGKTIQFRPKTPSSSGWGLVTDPEALLNFTKYEYRVAHRRHEVWINEYPDGLCHSASYPSEESAKRGAGSYALQAVHFREVMEDEK